MVKFYIDKPPDYQSGLEVSAVFIECQKDILLVQRSPEKIQGGRWSIPGGKLEKNETPLQGLIREIEEELSLFPNPQALILMTSLYARHPIMDYQLHLFKWSLSSYPSIKINKEHQNYKWQSIGKFAEVALIDGQLESFYYVYPRNRRTS